jgi:biopolymer transport protein ExbB
MLRSSKIPALFSFFSFFFCASAFAQNAPAQSPTLWTLLVSGGPVVILMLITSVAATASIIYHFQNVTPEKLTPREFTENLIFLLEKKEFQKAVSVCKQQENMISAIALKGLSKASQGKAVVESAVQYEGKARIEKVWQNLNYLGDIAVVAPMLGLLGTTLGMIDAFNFFKAGTLHPGMLTGGLAKAMINTALGLVIAVPCLVFYSYFRGRVSQITSNAETAAAEIMHTIAK